MLAACGDDRPERPTAEQSEQLDEAEAMLNAAAANEKGPEAEASDPSSED